MPVRALRDSLELCRDLDLHGACFGEYSIALIPAVRRMEYVAALETAHTDGDAFVDFIADCVVATQTDLLRLLKNSGGVKIENGGVNRTGNGGVNLTEQILKEIRNNPGLNAPAIADRLSLALRTTQRHLKDLKEQEGIEFRGAPKNGGYYKV